VYLRQKPNELENILLLVEIMFTFSHCTAACQRCSLGQESFCQLMAISVHEFNSQKDQMAIIKRAVNKWLCSGHKHIDGHKLYDSSTKSSSSASEPGGRARWVWSVYPRAITVYLCWSTCSQTQNLKMMKTFWLWKTWFRFRLLVKIKYQNASFRI